MVQFMRLIAVVVLYDVGAMWVRVVLWSCRWDVQVGWNELEVFVFFCHEFLQDFLCW